jgi:hypothetical protein
VHKNNNIQNQIIKIKATYHPAAKSNKAQMSMECQETQSRN